jgi:hypothetical protein
MIANTLLATTVLLLAAAFALLEASRCLIPYRSLIVQDDGHVLLAFVGVVALNLFGGLYLVSRALLLKDTGRKLAHLEKQIRQGHSLVADLAERLED